MALELPTAVDDDIIKSAKPATPTDPGAAIFSEVEQGMQGMIEQHTAWLELCAAGQRGEEYDWRTAELLSCLRSIEWDLQDLEDHVSIVEGNRPKYPDMDDEVLSARKTMVETVRKKIDAVRGNVSQMQQASEGGHAAVRAKASSTLASLQAQLKGKGKGFNKLEADKKEGTGVFSASKSAAVASGGESSPRGASSSCGGAADGGAGNGLGGAGASVGSGGGTDAADGERKPWWLCCC